MNQFISLTGWKLKLLLIDFKCSGGRVRADFHLKYIGHVTYIPCTLSNSPLPTKYNLTISAVE